MIDLSKYPNLLKDGCPWVDLRNQFGLPNVKWCEETLCQFVAEPANTWSNLGYIFVGVLFFFIARREKSRVLRYYSHAAMWVGWTSLIYHLTVTYILQILDFVGMYVYFFMIIVQNLTRLGRLKEGNEIRNIWIATAVATIASTIGTKIGAPVQASIMILFPVIFWTEWKLSQSPNLPKNTHYGYFFGTCATITAAAYCSFLDVSRHWCQPENHVLQGHASWHMFGAIALFLSYFHYRQFYSKETGLLIR
jgi:hypothetical protein